MPVWFPKSDSKGRPVDPEARETAISNASRLLAYRRSELPDETVHMNAIDSALLATAAKPHGTAGLGYIFAAVFRAVNKAIRGARMIQLAPVWLENFAARDKPLDFELAIALEQAVDKLSPADRALILDHFVSGRTWRQIGQSLGISEEAARNRARKARAALRGYLSNTLPQKERGKRPQGSP